jgi:transcriptional regulator with GAF, ATPase, and Fis domain
MTATSASQAFVNATAAMVQNRDVIDTLATLLADCARFTTADAIGLLVKNSDGELELLSATSHVATELELYQLQHDAGPCVDAARDGVVVSEQTDEAITQRWGKVGEAFLAAGFHAVHGVPLRWHGRLIGAMGAFHTDPATLDHDTHDLTQGFADIATVVIVQSPELTEGQLEDRVRIALAGRIVVEQAKGVLAQTTGLDMAAAYRLLVERAGANGTTLTETARELIRQAQRRD